MCLICKIYFYILFAHTYFVEYVKLILKFPWDFFFRVRPSQKNLEEKEEGILHSYRNKENVVLVQG